MSESKSKGLNVLLALIALICFLSLDFITQGSKSLTGVDFLDWTKEMKKAWPLLYVAIPILQIALRLLVVSKKEHAILCSCLMFVPIVVTFIEMDISGSAHFDIGFYMYLIISISMVVVAFKIEEEEQTSVTAAVSVKTEEEKALARQKQEIREEYDEQRLQDVVNKPEMYNEALVDECRKELEIRANAEKIMPEVEEYDNDKIEEILSNQTTYSAALVYCCEKVMAERLHIRQEEEKRRAEEERIRKQQEAEEERKRMEKEAEEKRQRNAALWQKYKKYVFIGTAVLVVLIVIAYLNSDVRHYTKGAEAFEEGDMKKAIEWLSKVSEDYKEYSSASYMLYQSYLAQKDSTNAGRVLGRTVKDNDWEVNPEAYKTYVTHLMKGTFRPYILPNGLRAAHLMKTSSDRGVRLIAAEQFFKNEKYAEAYSIFNSEAYGDAIYEKKANGYLGLYYLFGLNGMEKDLKKAKEYLDKASDNAPFLDYKLVLALAQIPENKRYTALGTISRGILRYKEGYIGAINRDMIAAIMSELADNRLKYCKEDDWGFHGGDWYKYDFNNDTHRGSYEGMNGRWNGGKDAGAHRGWGCFVSYNKSSKTKWVMFGKYHQCKHQGPGVQVGMCVEENTLKIWYGDFEKDRLKNGGYWDNSSIDKECFAKYEIDLPF